MRVTSGHKKTREKKGEGGMIMGIRKKLADKNAEMAVDKEGVITGHVRQGKVEDKVGVYVSGDMIEQKLRKVEQ